jgi:Fuc2NAc and GlcNAc transferase
MQLILCLSSLLLGSAGAWAAQKFAFRWGFIDNPNDRSSHDNPTPKGGGIGILVAFIIVSLFLKIGFTFWFPTAFLGFLSLGGDRFNLSPKIRLLLQFIAAVVLIQFSGLSFQPKVFWFVFLAVFVVATANWFNFMDGINGIAGIAGMVGFSLLALFIFLSGSDSLLLVLSICMALSCLGFLPFNMPKASVFMGDVGSVLLGFAFAAVVVVISKSYMDFVCLSAFLFPFYADELTTMAIRIRDGADLLKAHRRHLYQIMANEMGIKHWRISIGYAILQVIVGMGVLLIRPFGFCFVLSLILVFYFGFVWINYVARTRVGNMKIEPKQ